MLFMLLSACVDKAASPTLTPIEAQQPTNTPSLTPTDANIQTSVARVREKKTATARLTEQVLNKTETVLALTPSSTPSPSITPSNTPTNTPTDTPIPTLSLEEGHKLFLELIETNGGCELPCWWGITPGKTSMQDVTTLVTHLSSIANYTYLGKVKLNQAVGDLEIIQPGDSKDFSIRWMFSASSEDNIVTKIGISTMAYKETGDTLKKLYGNPYYNELLNDYTLPKILSSYGPPSQMFITADILYPGVDSKLRPRDTFKIRVLYPEQGIFVRYSMPVESSGDNYLFCPSRSFVNMNLIAPYLDNNEIQTIMADSDWEVFFEPSRYNKSPKEAIEMTIDEFYQIFRSPTDQCLETPKSIWPEH
jgi:hypothetical protein